MLIVYVNAFFGYYIEFIFFPFFQIVHLISEIQT